MPHKRVLIVDDEESVRDLLVAVLEGRDIELETAASGEEGLAKALESDFDLIVSDLKMPGLNGAQFCEKLRAARPHAPRFVFMTGDVLSSETHSFLESTNSLCMLKPFDIQTANDTVTLALTGGNKPRHTRPQA